MVISFGILQNDTYLVKKNLLKLIAALIVLSGAVSAFGQVSYADSIRYSNQLISIEQQLMDDLAGGISINWNKCLHENWFVVTEDGSKRDKKTFLADLKPLPKGYSGYIKIIKPKTVFYNNTAVISYVADEYESVFENKLHTNYGVMNTYVRNDTSWTMISSEVFEIPQLPPPIDVPVAILKKYTGLYQLSDSNTCIISLKNDTLFYQRNGRPQFALLPETETIFFRMADTRGRKIFVEDENGIMLMRERRNGQDVIWKRIKKNF
jgi:hypothetical protein